MKRIVTFGEIMARMAPAGTLRLQQVLPGSLDVTFAGAEANVAVSLAMLKCPVSFVTALPDGPLTDACITALRGTGVCVDHIRVTDQGRLGIFFVETGANQRPTRVWYDRDHSAMSLATPEQFDWVQILTGASWLHLTGITPALSATAAATTLAAAKAARELGVRVSLDCNFRSKLWRWDPDRAPWDLAASTLRDLLPWVNLLFGNEEDYRLLGIASPDAAAKSPADQIVCLANAARSQFPELQLFAATFREQISASHNNWSGMLYCAETGRMYQAPMRNGVSAAWEIRQIVDRVGSGDAFDAGILFGLAQDEFDPQYTIDLATAAGCLAHSISGDWNFATRQEIEELTQGTGSGRVVR